jgi:four helix bundle protein
LQRFTDLKVWQRSHRLVLRVYKLSEAFPTNERFGVTAQLRRAILSVPTNIAEGSKRLGRHDYARFLNFAEGSLAETEYLLMVSRDLGFISAEKAKPLLDEATEVARMLNRLREAVESTENRTSSKGSN